MANSKRQVPTVGTTTDIVELGSPGAGGVTIAHVNGTPVFVRHGIAGEKVRVVITAAQSRIAFGEVTEIVKPAPTRVPTVWPDAGPGGVGGAELGHVQYAAQAAWKSEVLNGTIRRLGKLSDWEDVEVEQPEDTGLGQRLRAEVIVTDDNRLGMHRYRSDELLPISELPLAHPTLYPSLLETIDRDELRPGSRIRALATMRGVRIALPDGVVVTKHGREVADTVYYRVGEDDYTAPATGFWQPHTDGAKLLRETVEAFSGNPTIAVDLYCGAGLFTVSLGRVAQEVRALEMNETAVDHALSNCERLEVTADTKIGVANINSKMISEITEGADTVVADPPRTGLGRGGIDAITKSKSVRRLVYVACDYAALARDLGRAVRNGWQIEHKRALDLFPHTHHIETVVALTR